MAEQQLHDHCLALLLTVTTPSSASRAALFLIVSAQSTVQRVWISAGKAVCHILGRAFAEERLLTWWAAHSKAVHPAVGYSSRACRSAPLSRKSLTSSMLPLHAAHCSGVSFLLLVALGFAPAFNRVCAACARKAGLHIMPAGRNFLKESD